MTNLNQTNGLEDPFTGPRAVTVRSSRSTSFRARGQRTMSALSQTLASRLNSAKAQSRPSPDQKSFSDSTSLPRSPVAIYFPQQSSIPVASNLTLEQGRPAINRSFSANTTRSSSVKISGSQVAPRKSTSGLPSSSVFANNSDFKSGPQRSLSGPYKASSHPALRSNVRKSSLAANLPAREVENKPVARRSTSNSTVAHTPSSSPTTQRVLGTAVSTSILVQTHSSSSVPTVAAVHQLPPLLAPQVPHLKAFTVFPQLPMELQQEIWSIAIAVQYHQEKRFLRVAPDPKSLDRTDDDAEHSQLRIISDIHRRPRLVPSLLHVCQHTRHEAIKGYELWGCTDPITYDTNDAKVYVKVDVDSFFFGDADLDDFWVLHTFFKESEPENADADDTARGNFIEQIGLIKHFTFDYELWIQCTSPQVAQSNSISTETKSVSPLHSQC
ncbi:hypothetical protein ONS96_012206 [Cadophora gregata f. sp. sojae]|nr:hypothetical protein ONS96_012206 [Cadophora gregata f. sp. sojae]